VWMLIRTTRKVFWESYSSDGGQTWSDAKATTIDAAIRNCSRECSSFSYVLLITHVAKALDGTKLNQTIEGAQKFADVLGVSPTVSTRRSRKFRAWLTRSANLLPGSTMSWLARRSSSEAGRTGKSPA